MHRGPKVHTVRDRASVLNAEKSRKREYTILRRERKKTMRNDIDVEENVSTEHQPTQEKDPIDVPKFNISQYVTVLPDGKAKGKCFWGFQGFISQVNVDDEGVSYEIKNTSLHGNDRVVMLHRDINWGMEVKMEAKFRHLSMKYIIQG